MSQSSSGKESRLYDSSLRIKFPFFYTSRRIYTTERGPTLKESSGGAISDRVFWHFSADKVEQRSWIRSIRGSPSGSCGSGFGGPLIYRRGGVGEKIEAVASRHEYASLTRTMEAFPKPLKNGVKGLSYPRYDDTICTYCSGFTTVILRAIANAWKGNLGWRGNSNRQDHETHTGKKKTILIEMHVSGQQEQCRYQGDDCCKRMPPDLQKPWKPFTRRHWGESHLLWKYGHGRWIFHEEIWGEPRVRGIFFKLFNKVENSIIAEGAILNGPVEGERAMSNETLLTYFQKHVKEEPNRVALRHKDYGICTCHMGQYGEKIRQVAMDWSAWVSKKENAFPSSVRTGRNGLFWFWDHVAGGITAEFIRPIRQNSVDILSRTLDRDSILQRMRNNSIRLWNLERTIPSGKGHRHGDGGLETLQRPMLMSFDDLLKLGKEFDAKNPGLFEQRCNEVKPDDLAVLIYTSGTTGPPKGRCSLTATPLYEWSDGRCQSN